MKTQYAYIHFVRHDRDPSKKKTDVWEIHNNKSNDLLGYIEWHGPWRQYCFFPEAGTIFNIGCLADIDAFIREAMQNWRKERDQRRSNRVEHEDREGQRDGGQVG
ncbi:MAG TPA: hypothetical protein VFI02_18025 [Armatimonadota bacterium]|nr:hypothetical protein [Armatimonadota bacterium]